MIKTGKAPIGLMTYLAIMSISLIVNLPGLAVAPMEGKLKEILHAPELEVQLLTTLPNFIIIPFVLLSGKLSEAKHKIPIIVGALIIYVGCAIVYLFADSMGFLIIISCLLGCGAGLLIPFSTGLIADTFAGKYRMQQMGWQSGISNTTVVIATFAVGWLIQGKNWHLPFIVYLAAGIPLIFSIWLKNVPGITISAKSEAKDEAETEQATASAAPAPVTAQDAPQPELEQPHKYNEQEACADAETRDSLAETAEDAANLAEKAAQLTQRAAEMTEEAAQLTRDAAAIARGEKVSKEEIDAIKEAAQQPFTFSEFEHEIQENEPNVTEVPVVQEETVRSGFNVGRIWSLIAVYFFVTFTSIAITNYVSQLVAQYKWDPNIAGDVTAMFFLFVLIPGYILMWFVKRLKANTFFWTALMMLVGLGLFVFIKAPWAMLVGAALTGLGYGICQPMLYDKASYTVTNPGKITLALAFVLTANYFAIAIQPFVISGIGKLFHVHDENTFAFGLSFALVIGYTILTFILRKKFAFDVEKSYYS